MTSSNGNIFRVTCLCDGDPLATGGSPPPPPPPPPPPGQWHGTLMFSLICAWTNEQTIETQVTWDAITLSLWRHCNLFIAEVATERKRTQGVVAMRKIRLCLQITACKWMFPQLFNCFGICTEQCNTEQNYKMQLVSVGELSFMGFEFEAYIRWLQQDSPDNPLFCED